MYRIPWPDYIETYNNRYNVKTGSVKEMLSDSYKREGSMERVADVFGVCTLTVRREMSAHGLKTKQRFGNPETRAKDSIREMFTPEKTAVMKSKEIAEAIGKSQFAVIYALKQLGWTWQWGKNQFTRHYRRKAKAPQSAAAFPIR